MKPAHKRGVKIALLALVLYLASYAWLSARGEYSTHMFSLGKNLYPGGLPMRDVYVWDPQFVVQYRYTSNWLGKLYYPLVCMDRKFFHANINVFEDPRIRNAKNARP